MWVTQWYCFIETICNRPQLYLAFSRKANTVASFQPVFFFFFKPWKSVYRQIYYPPKEAYIEIYGSTAAEILVEV